MYVCSMYSRNRLNGRNSEDSATSPLLEMSGHAAAAADQKVALRTPVLLVLVHAPDVLLQLGLGGETFPTAATHVGLYSVSWM